MEKYKLISFDMFQTLVDVNTQKEAVRRHVCVICGKKVGDFKVAT